LDLNESSGDSGDEYIQERQEHKTAKPKKPRKSRLGEDDGERKASRKRKRKLPTRQEINEMDPEAAKKAQLDLTIDAILKTKKATKSKRKKKDAEEEALDRFADEEVSRLRDTMVAAADEDMSANKERLPATSKLRMLPQVMDVLQKSGMSQSILDNNLLEGVRRWLEPLPDKSLPALNIQNAFFETLSKMYIDTNSLKDSGLGRVVIFYTKCKRVTPHISRIANTLVTAWSRPIIKRSASYRDRHVPIAAESDQPAHRPKLHEILKRAENESKHSRARLPQSTIGSYQVAPRSAMKNPSVEAELERRRRNAERMRAMTRHMKGK